MLQRLCEYAYMYSSGRQSAPASFAASDWQKLAAIAAENTQSQADALAVGERDRLCRTVSRCLWLVQSILDSVHGSHKPTLLPHHASAKGSPVELSVVLQNGLADADGSRLAPGMVMDKAQRVLTMSTHSLMVCSDYSFLLCYRLCTAALCCIWVQCVMRRRLPVGIPDVALQTYECIANIRLSAQAPAEQGI